jgi:2-dehydro-3-deoxy-D-arabinonate dehydratase
MRFGQIYYHGAVCAAIFEGGKARPVPGVSGLDLALNPALAAGAGDILDKWHATVPLNPPEVWGCGCTYETSASFRDAEHGTREGMYAYVYREARPEVFFKGTSRVCTGPGEPIGIRCDSQFTAPEPELALVLGEDGRIAGYTLANDVSAWDIERENALYLTQSKVYDRCCALGPVVVTPDEIGDVHTLEMTCRITRGSVERFAGSVSISRLHRKLETLVEYLTRANSVPPGSVLLTGTGIIVTKESALAPGDVVTIAVAGIGELSNPAMVVG